MELFNQFFVSYNVVQGPKIVCLEKSQVGTITFFPSKKNMFVEDQGLAFVFDNDDVGFSGNIRNFLKYLGTPEYEFQNLCISLWIEEFGISPKVFIINELKRKFVENKRGYGNLE